MKTQKQLEEGCRKYSQIKGIKGQDNFLEKYFHCGDEGYLCDKCKSLLLQKQEDKKRVLEIIQGIFYKEGKEFPIVSIDRVFELKQAVEKI